MVYDEARRQVVLFGGQSEGKIGGGAAELYLNDTWTWDGKNWSHKAPVTSPPKGSRPFLVYDAKQGRVVGLIRNEVGAYEMWTWSGNAWNQVQTPFPVPGSGFGAAAAYDVAHGLLVVFDRDTWTFDGETWTHHATIGEPRRRTGATMAYDPSTGRVVMFGGADPIGFALYSYFSETWTWDGTKWTQAHPTDSPWARTEAIAVTDSAGKRVILFWGRLYSGGFGLTYSDVWTWADGSWTLANPTTMPASADQTDAILAAASVGPGLRALCTAASQACMAVHGEPQLGFYAAYVLFDLKPPEGKNALCISYLSYVTERNRMFASGPWHQVGVACGPSDANLLQLGTRARIHVAGCANVRTFPAAGKVVRCLPNGTSATIDDGPIAITGDTQRLWWHLQKQGWIANELLATG